MYSGKIKYQHDPGIPLEELKQRDPYDPLTILKPFYQDNKKPLIITGSYALGMSETLFEPVPYNEELTIYTASENEISLFPGRLSYVYNGSLESYGTALTQIDDYVYIVDDFKALFDVIYFDLNPDLMVVTLEELQEDGNLEDFITYCHLHHLNPEGFARLDDYGFLNGENTIITSHYH